MLPILNHPYDPDTYSAGLIPIVSGFVAGRAGFSLNRYLFVART